MSSLMQIRGLCQAMDVSGQVSFLTTKIEHSTAQVSRAALSENSGFQFLDELSTLGDNTVAEFYQERGFAMSTLSPEAFALQPATLSDLAGGDCETNARIVTALLAG